MNISPPYLYSLGFFFSSRRRHTRWPRDWSSDVCSSDLAGSSVTLATGGEIGEYLHPRARREVRRQLDRLGVTLLERSEERRVGKECRSRGVEYVSRKNEISQETEREHEMRETQNTGRQR